MNTLSMHLKHKWCFKPWAESLVWNYWNRMTSFPLATSQALFKGRIPENTMQPFVLLLTLGWNVYNIPSLCLPLPPCIALGHLLEGDANSLPPCPLPTVPAGQLLQATVTVEGEGVDEAAGLPGTGAGDGLDSHWETQQGQAELSHPGEKKRKW